MVDLTLSVGPPYVQDDEFLTRSDVVLSGNDVSFRLNNNNGQDAFSNTYTGINGVDVADGETITLPSGALLTLFENGRFEYDPNGAVAQNGVDEIDTFTYTAQPFRIVIAGEPEEAPPEPVTATVEIIIQAADRPGETVSGDASDEEITGGAGTDFFDGGAGNDELFGRDGDDILLGGDGNDQLFGEDGNDVLRGGSGIDVMYGGAGDDIYIIEDEADVVVESQSSFFVSQNKRFPGLLSESAFERITTRTDGEDDGSSLISELMRNPFTFPVKALTLDYPVDAGEGGFDTIYSRVSYMLPSFIEKLVLLGDADLNAIGSRYDDELHGNAGANILNGLGGQDQMFGSGGNDIYIVNNAADTTVENAGEGNDTVRSNISWALSNHIENLILEEYSGETSSALVVQDSPGSPTAAIRATGNDLANTITGNSEDNVIDGGAGTDVMIGRDGNDRYVVDDSRDRVVEEAGDGDDIVFASADYFLDDNVEILVLEGDAVTGHGNDGDNTIIGNDGANVLMGHGGTDYMLGGEGDDIFVLTKLAGSDVDVIGDFEGAGVAGGDRIAFSAADYGTNGIVTQVSQTSFIVSRADGSNAQQFIVSKLEAGNGGLSEDDYYFG